MTDFIEFIFSIEIMLLILSINALVFMIKEYIKVVTVIKPNIRKLILVPLPSILGCILALLISTSGHSWILVGLSMGLISNSIYMLFKKNIKYLSKRLEKDE